MEYPIINAAGNPKGNTTNFMGINRRDVIAEGEFSDCTNLSTEHYPCLAPRKSRLKYGIGEQIKNIQAIIAPKYKSGGMGGFTGVADGKFYYMDKEIEFEADDMGIEKNSIVCLVDFNGYIIICPQMYYFSYVPQSDGEIEYKVKKMEKGKDDIKVTLYSSGDIESDGAVENYLKAADSSAWDCFESGNSIMLSGFSGDLEKNNTVEIDSVYKVTDDKVPISCVIERIDGKKMYFQMYNQKGVALNLTNGSGIANGVSAVISVRIPIPAMNWVCVHNNRLWGTNPNGELIYASKIGDAFNFNTFMGLTSDSWYSQVATKGDFIGIASYRSNVVAFKRDYVQHVYGDKPVNFQIPKQLSDCGCIDMRSVVEIGSVLYFMGYNGFYAYTGGQPELISDKLCKKYKSAVAFSDGIKYMVSADTGEGECEFLVFDPRYNIWLKEDGLQVVSSLKWHNGVYAATADSVYKFNDGAENVEFSASSGWLFEDMTNQKGINELFIVADIKGKGRVDVYTKSENGGLKLWGTINKPGYRTYHIPVKLIRDDCCKIILKGEGDVIIHRIERRVSTGGKNYADK